MELPYRMESDGNVIFKGLFLLLIPYGAGTVQAMGTIVRSCIALRYVTFCYNILP